MEQRYGIGIVDKQADPMEIVNAMVKHDIQLVGTQPFDANVNYAAYLQAQQELDTKLAFLFVFPKKSSVLIDSPDDITEVLEKYVGR